MEPYLVVVDGYGIDGSAIAIPFSRINQAGRRILNQLLDTTAFSKNPAKPRRWEKNEPCFLPRVGVGKIVTPGKLRSKVKIGDEVPYWIHNEVLTDPPPRRKPIISI